MPKRRFLILKGCAGLGNRLISLYCAINYCSKTNRTLIVDWRDGQFDVRGEEAFRKCFNIQHVDVEGVETIDRLSSLKHSSNLYRDNSHAGIYDLYYERHSKFWEHLPYWVLCNSNLKKLRRRWQPLENGNIFNSINFGSDLSYRLNDDVVYFIDQLPYINYNKMSFYITLNSATTKKVNEISMTMQIQRLVGVHIRNTDKKPSLNIDQLVTCLKRNHPAAELFLSTDSKEVEKLFRDTFDKVHMTEKHRPDLGTEGLHQWALYNKRDELKYRLYEESVIDMFLLSKCEYLYYQGNSSFSNVSRVYHQNKANCFDWLKEEIA